MRWVFAIVAAVGGVAALVIAKRASAMTSSAPGSLSPVRAKVVAIARGAVGLNADTRLHDFEEFLGGPGETDTMKNSMALSDKSSTCELTARAVLREAGFTHKSLVAPYAIGSGIEPIYEFAKANGAWVVATPDVFPKPGDVIGLDFPKANAHVDIAVEADPNAHTLTTVDGGAIDAEGKQSVAQRTKTWTVEGGAVIDHPNFGNVHNVSGWIDVDKLAAVKGAFA